MRVFDKLRAGEPVDMMSEEYRPAIEELTRANIALYHVNHTEPFSEENAAAMRELFCGQVPEGLGQRGGAVVFPLVSGVAVRGGHDGPNAAVGRHRRRP